MKKIILGLFIILFCFSIGIAGVQEEKVKLTIKQIEKRAVISFLWQEMEKLLEKRGIAPKEDIKLYYEELANLCEEMSKAYEKIAVLSREIVAIEKELQSPGKQLEQKKDVLEPNRLTDDYEHRFSWLDKYTDATKADKLEEENDRLEDLTGELERIKRDIESERYALDLDMISHRWSMLELSSRLEFDLLFNPFLSLPFGYRYEYPTYSTKTYRTNYEPSLFRIWALSPGKKDWIKYWRLKLLLQNR